MEGEGKDGFGVEGRTRGNGQRGRGVEQGRGREVIAPFCWRDRRPDLSVLAFILPMTLNDRNMWSKMILHVTEFLSM